MQIAERMAVNAFLDKRNEKDLGDFCSIHHYVLGEYPSCSLCAREDEE